MSRELLDALERADAVDNLPKFVALVGEFAEAAVSEIEALQKRPCESCVQLRAQIVEALQGVDSSDWDSMSGSQPRSLGAVLRDIASRLEALGAL